jgi:threonine/homoserine/homoserine lactone efflux protein
MDAERWLAFAAASLLMGIVPGPGVLNIVGTAIAAGRRVALAAVAGLAIGNALAMTLSLAGVGALLAASASAFAVLKWAGAAYLIVLGVWTLRRRLGDASADTAPPIGARAAFAGTLAIGTFHPKTIVFFVAFAPQFIRADRPYVPQAAVLIATFCLVVGMSDTGYALAAARAAHRLRGPAVRRWANRIGGGVLVAAGVATAAARR